MGIQVMLGHILTCRRSKSCLKKEQPIHFQVVSIPGNQEPDGKWEHLAVLVNVGLWSAAVQPLGRIPKAFFLFGSCYNILLHIRLPGLGGTKLPLQLSTKRATGTPSLRTFKAASSQMLLLWSTSGPHQFKAGLQTRHPSKKRAASVQGFRASEC